MVNHVSMYFFLSATPFQSSASGNGSLERLIIPNCGESSAFSSIKGTWSFGTSSSAKMAFAGHSGTQTAQSMHSSGSMTRKLGPSRKQSTGHTSTQSVYLHLMQFSVTTWVISTLQDLLRDFT